MRNQEEKFELQKKVRRRVCVSEITFLAAHPPSYVIFLSLFLSTPFLSSTPVFLRKKCFFVPENGGGGGGGGGAGIYGTEGE